MKEKTNEKNEGKKEKKLKPVVFVTSRYNYNKSNKFQECLLLKSLKVTQDPKKLKEMIGVRTVAEVYRTLDKLAMRKEYHKALIENGIDFNYIVQGIKNDICDNPIAKPSEKLKGFQALLKSLGMDEYKSDNTSGGSWEEALTKVIEGESEEIEEENETTDEDLYEVKPVALPESVKKKQEEEDKLADSLYG